MLEYNFENSGKNRYLFFSRALKNKLDKSVHALRGP